MNGVGLPERWRAYIYNVLIVLQPVVVYYGILQEQEALLWIDAVVTLVGGGLARANTSTSRRGGTHGSTETHSVE